MSEVALGARMIINETELITSALALPIERRAALVRVLLDSLPDQDPQSIAAAWRAEISKRLDDIDGGRTRAIPAEEVFDELLRND